jgi:N-acyl-L-homoserine lactone synthetase
MKVLYKLTTKIKNSHKMVIFGIPDNEEELKKMFSLRVETYKKKEYINSDSDLDEYDENKKCTYFIAKIDDDVIGTVRLIMDNPLPTEKDCFDFKEPEAMKGIDPNTRGELSRLISVPYKGEIFLPKHLVLIFLIACVVKYSKENKILGGYSFITTKLYGKIKKIKVPFHLIKDFKKKYPENGLLGPYFNNEDNQILPIYYKLEDIDKYLTKFLSNRIVFENVEGSGFKIKDNLYTKILKLLKIL